MELFKGWFTNHFLRHAVNARLLLLLLDGHSSHYNPDAIRLVKENDVILFTLVPHTTHESSRLILPCSHLSKLIGVMLAMSSCRKIPER